MEQIINYIKPELVPVAVVCYIIGAALKHTELLKDKYIPVVLGAFSVLTCAVYVCATSDLSTAQNVLMAVFVAVVQGLLLAGGSVYVNQIIKQTKKEEK